MADADLGPEVASVHVTVLPSFRKFDAALRRHLTSVSAQAAASTSAAERRASTRSLAAIRRDIETQVQATTKRLQQQEREWGRTLAEAYAMNSAFDKAKMRRDAKAWQAMLVEAYSMNSAFNRRVRQQGAEWRRTVAEAYAMNTAFDRARARSSALAWRRTLAEAYAMNKAFDRVRAAEVRSANHHNRMLALAAARAQAVRAKLMGALSGSARAGGVTLGSNALSGALGILTSGLRGVGPAVTGFTTQVGSLGLQLGSAAANAGPLGIAIAAIGAAAVAATLPLIGMAAALGAVSAKLASIGVEEGAKLQLVALQLRTVLGDARAAADMTNYVVQLSKESITTTETLLSATRLLAAFGIKDSASLKETVKFVADYSAAAGLATDQSQALALALGQVSAMGRLMGQERIQLANIGINTDEIFRSLDKYANKSSDQLRKLGEQGKLSASDFFAGLRTYYSGISDAALEASRTVTGLLQKIQDNVKFGLAQAFNAPEGVLSSIQGVLSKIAELTKKIRFDRIAFAIKTLVDAIIGGLGGDAQSTFDSLLTFINDTLPRAIVRLSVVVSGIVEAVKTMFAGIAASFGVLWGAFDTTTSQADATVTAMKGLVFAASGVGTMFLAIAQIWRAAALTSHTLIRTIGALANVLAKAAVGDYTGAWQAASQYMEDTGTAWTDFVDDSIEANKNLVESVSAALAAIDEAAAQAKGNEWALDNLTPPTKSADVTNSLRAAAEAEWNAYIEGMQRGLEKAKKARKKLLDEFRQFRSSIVSSLTDYVNDVTTEQREVTRVRFFDNGDTSGYTSWTTTVSRSLLSQMRERLEKVKKFVGYLRTALRRGVDKSILRAVIDAGPEAGFDAARELATKPDSYIRQINTIERELQRTVKSAAREIAGDYYGTDIDNAKAEVISLKELIRKAQVEMKKDLASIVPTGPDGKAAGTYYGEAIREGIEEAFVKPIRATLDWWTPDPASAGPVFPGGIGGGNFDVDVYIGDQQINDLIDTKVRVRVNDALATVGTYW